MKSKLPAILSLTALVSACGSEKKLAPEPGEALSGGDLTVENTTRDAFAQLAPNATDAHSRDFFSGNGSIFNRNWTIAPSSTVGTDGLGPTFNAKSCSSCHFKDGRGEPPAAADDAFLGLLIRLSIPGESAHGGPLGVPGYGDQLNPDALPIAVPAQDGGDSVMALAEGTPHVSYEEEPVVLGDGSARSLRRPTYTIDDLNFGPLPDDVLMSPRVAPAVFGLGLLESVPERDLLDREDPDDRDGDGISGRANRVWDPVTESVQLGRIGWKANQAGLAQQNAAAFNGDIGITSPMFPEQNCPEEQEACARAVNGGEPEIDQDKLDLLNTYTRLLAVPARRDVAEHEVLAGKAVFRRLACNACHVETMHTDDSALMPELANQTFHPYTDLLLHDMGDGLADGRPDFLADGNEWRTPPLWGLGLVSVVNRHTTLLHDGRARDAEEAVLWHGGEAQAARDGYVALDADERAELLAFLGSL